MQTKDSLRRRDALSKLRAFALTEDFPVARALFTMALTEAKAALEVRENQRRSFRPLKLQFLTNPERRALRAVRRVADVHVQVYEFESFATDHSHLALLVSGLYRQVAFEGTEKEARRKDSRRRGFLKPLDYAGTWRSLNPTSVASLRCSLVVPSF